MAALEWDRCYQLAIPTFGAAAAAFGTSQFFRTSSAMSWPGEVLQGASTAALCVALVFTWLAIVRHPIVKRWPWRVALVLLAVLSASLVFFLFRMVGLTERGQGTLSGIGGLLLLEGVRRLIVGYYLRKKMRRESERVAAEEAARALALTEKTVPEDVLDRLRVIHARCKPAFQQTHGFLSSLCSGEQATKERSRIAQLTQAHVLPPLRERTEALEVYFHVPRPLKEEEFVRLKSIFRDVLGKYIEVGCEIGHTGRLFLGEEGFDSSQGYAELLRHHKACLVALDETVGSVYFRDITASHLALVKTLFLKPN